MGTLRKPGSARGRAAAIVPAEVLPTESQEQIRVMTWARWQENVWPDLRLLHAVPNGGSRTHRVKKLKSGRQVKYSPEGQRMALEGVKSGVPDLDLPVARRGYIGLRIEMKRKGGRVSPEQLLWHRLLTEAGHLVGVCWNADEAIDLLTWYMAGRRTQLQPDQG